MNWKKNKKEQDAERLQEVMESSSSASHLSPDEIAEGMRNFMVQARPDELNALTDVLEKMSQKLVRLAFLVDSLADQQEAQEADIPFEFDDSGLEVSAIQAAKPLSDVKN